MASRVSLQVARSEENFPFFNPRFLLLVRNVSQECFQVGDASGVTMSQRPYNHGFLSMSSFCMRIVFMEEQAFLYSMSKLATFMVDLSVCFLKEFLGFGEGKGEKKSVLNVLPQCSLRHTP